MNYNFKYYIYDLLVLAIKVNPTFNDYLFTTEFEYRVETFAKYLTSK